MVEGIRNSGGEGDPEGIWVLAIVFICYRASDCKYINIK